MPTAPKEPKKTARARKAKAANTTSLKATRQMRDEGDNPGDRHWRTRFLDHLVATSNITAAARMANISPTRAYRTRRGDPDFAAKWQEALFEGYENLEMELLGYLRTPNPEHKMDLANAIRILTLHKQSVAHRRAQTDDRSEKEVLDSIDAMIDEMRSRAAANAALLAEADGGEAHEDE